MLAKQVREPNLHVKRNQCASTCHLPFICCTTTTTTTTTVISACGGLRNYLIFHVRAADSFVSAQDIVEKGCLGINTRPRLEADRLVYPVKAYWCGVA